MKDIVSTESTMDKITGILWNILRVASMITLLIGLASLAAIMLALVNSVH